MKLQSTKKVITEKGGIRTQRKSKRRTQAIASSPILETLTVDPWPAVEAKLDAHTLLMRLPELERSIVSLHYLCGLPISRVAELLTMDRHDVSTRLNEAIRYLF